MARTITTTITASPTRHGCTVNGNPMHTLHTADGDYRMQNDAGDNYAANNYRRGDRVTLQLSRSGRVETIRSA